MHTTLYIDKCNMNDDTKKESLSYIPSSNELPLFEALFRSANSTNNGNMITCKEALEVFSLACVSQKKLTMILYMAKNGKSLFLNKEQFYVAVRLVQLRQNHECIRNFTLTVPDDVHLNPPYFQGISELRSNLNNLSAPKIFKADINKRFNNEVNSIALEKENHKLTNELRKTKSGTKIGTLKKNIIRQRSLPSIFSPPMTSHKEIDNAMMISQKQPNILFSDPIVSQSYDSNDIYMNAGDNVSLLTETTKRLPKDEHGLNLKSDKNDVRRRRDSEITLPHSNCDVSKLNDISDSTNYPLLKRAISERDIRKRHHERAVIKKSYSFANLKLPGIFQTNNSGESEQRKKKLFKPLLKFRRRKNSK